ncbi:MAG: hypothetical protein Q9187_009024, partial [Circinaria calcarea]
EQLEEDIGRRLEEGCGRERADWEATYGDRPSLTPCQNDSGIGSEREIGSTRKLSYSSNIPEGTKTRTFCDHIEMDDLSRRATPCEQHSRDLDLTEGSSKITVHLLKGADALGNPIAQYRADEASVPTHLQSNSRISCKQSLQQQKGEEEISIAECEADDDKYRILEDVPLTYPNTSKTTEIDDGNSSIATFASSNHPRARLSTMLSNKSKWRNSLKRSRHHSLVKSTSREGLTETSNRHDQGSQERFREGIRDDELGMRNPRTPQPEDDQNLPLSSKQTHADLLASRLSLLQKSTGENESMDHDERVSTGEGNARVGGPFVNPVGMGHQNGNGLPGESLEMDSSNKMNDNESASKRDLRRPKSKVSVDITESAYSDSSAAKLSDRLPEDTPKIALAYRTSEWAKHLNAEDFPEVDELTVPNSDTSEVSEPSDQIAVPVNMTALQQTALNATPKPERTTYALPSYLQQPRSTSSIPRDFVAECRKSQDQQRINDQQSNYITTDLPTTVSPTPVAQQLLKLKIREVRSNSNPLVESPIEENIISITLEHPYGKARHSGAQ